MPRPKARFKIGNLDLKAAPGGLHSVDGPMAYYSTDTHEIISVDVSSYYPTLISTVGISPIAYGPVGIETYREILATRLRLKKESKATSDPAERSKLEVQANGLKLVLNSTFGKFGDPFSTLFDLRAMMAVTLTGQLMLIDLIERLREVEAEVLSANTDGLFIRVERFVDDWECVLRQWERDTSMSLEVEQLARFATMSTNAYASLDLSGKIKPPGQRVQERDFGMHSARECPGSQQPDRRRGGAGCLVPGRPAREDRARLSRPRHVLSRQQADEVGTLGDVAGYDHGHRDGAPEVVAVVHRPGRKKRIVHHLDEGRKMTPGGAIGVELLMDLRTVDCPAISTSLHTLKPPASWYRKLNLTGT